MTLPLTLGATGYILKIVVETPPEAELLAEIDRICEEGPLSISGPMQGFFDGMKKATNMFG